MRSINHRSWWEKPINLDSAVVSVFLVVVKKACSRSTIDVRLLQVTPSSKVQLIFAPVEIVSRAVNLDMARGLFVVWSLLHG